jgi:hypothetical protein
MKNNDDFYTVLVHGWTLTNLSGEKETEIERRKGEAVGMVDIYKFKPFATCGGGTTSTRPPPPKKYSQSRASDPAHISLIQVCFCAREI